MRPRNALPLAALAALLLPACFNPDDSPPDDTFGDDTPANHGAADDPSDPSSDGAPQPCAIEIYNYIEDGDRQPDLIHVYATPSDEDSWGSDLLDFPIVHGAGARIDDVPGGLWDVRVEDEDGTGYESYFAECDGGVQRWDVLADHASE